MSAYNKNHLFFKLFKSITYFK